ncbi:MAG: flavin reductase family protein [Hyphomicrobiaceae bacterium]|nr:flavin reductase family protein [Hyphomicrobiaceae bacterium]
MSDTIDPKDLAAEEAYKLVIGAVVPRPIAWVSTLNAQGRVNLAPFSAFTFVSPKPPMLAISVGRKGATYKDTGHNILAREEFVIHIANQELLGPLHQSSFEYPADVSEVDELGLETLPCRLIGTPRLAAAPIAMECRLRQVLEFGETRSRLMVGEVVMFHFRDGLLQSGKIDTKTLDPICRLGGPRYASLGDIITMQPVPQTPKS